MLIAGAVVVTSAAYLCYRARSKKQSSNSKSLKATFPSPVQENAAELKTKADLGDASAMCRLALILLKGDESSGVKQDVSGALELLGRAAENGDVEAMMCDPLPFNTFLPAISYVPCFVASVI